MNSPIAGLFLQRFAKQRKGFIKDSREAVPLAVLSKSEGPTALGHMQNEAR
jgi:hypothetical protein